MRFTQFLSPSRGDARAARFLRAGATLASLVLLAASSLAQGGTPSGGPSQANPVVRGVPVHGDPPSVAMRHAFSQIDLTQFQSGILLDLGSTLATDDILQRDGTNVSQDVGIGAEAFDNALGDLARSATIPGTLLPDYATWHTLVEAWHQGQGLTPISLAIVNYERVVPTAYSDGKLQYDGQYFHATVPVSSYSETRTWVASTVESPMLFAPGGCVIPSNLVIGNIPAASISNLQIQFAGQSPMAVGLDQPFTLSDATPDANGDVRYTLQFNVGTTIMQAAGVVAYAKMSPPPYSYATTITASIPYDGVKGQINVRLYPATNRTPPLEKVVVIVDGIDIHDNRTFDSIWFDFGSTLQKLLDDGFDLVVCDYTKGRDYIQRNGLALRTVLETIPQWMAPTHANDRAAVIAGSMGTQVARYALRTAELSGEDHHVGLFIAIDGPFTGANIPLSLQGFVKYFAPEKAEVQESLDGLNSPAASQLLRRALPTTSWGGNPYGPRQEYVDYYAEATPLGLPQRCRNVAVASGSGIDQRIDWKSVVTYLNASLIVFGVGVEVNAKSDFVGQVFHGYLKKPFTSPYTADVTLDDAPFIDLAPGGMRDTAKTIADGWNKSLINNVFVHMSSDQAWHCFIPTSSALDIPTTDLDYAPESDPLVRQKSPFDAIYYGAPNTGHVTPTDGNEQFIIHELDSFFGEREILLIGNLCADPGSGGGGGVTQANPLPTIHAPGLGMGTPDLDELLTINTFTRQAMIQRRQGTGWTTVWSNGSGSTIGGWYINTGDRFYMADIDGDSHKELVCVSSLVPAWAAVLSFDGTTWSTDWNNTGDGYMGPLWKIHTTDSYAFGKQTPSGKQSMLCVYPYQKHGSASLLFKSSSSWGEWWNNSDSDTVGGVTIQLGNQYSFARLDAQFPVKLFTINTWTNPSTWTVVQSFNVNTHAWYWFTSDYGAAKIGSSWIKAAGDRFEFADSDGDGLDELHCFSASATPNCAVLDFTPGTNLDWSSHWDNGGNGMLGTYPLTPPYKVFAADHYRATDKFVWGHLDAIGPLDALGIAPMVSGFPREERYATSSKSWAPEWSGTTMIGSWTLYQ